MPDSRPIILVTTHYPPMVGGAATFFSLLASSLVARGHHVIVLTTRQPNLPPITTDHNIEVRRLIPQLNHVPGAIRKWIQVGVTFGQLIGFLGRRPRVVHVHASKSVTVGAGLFSLVSRVPIVFEVQDFMSRPWALKLGVRQRYIATGEPIATHLRSLGIPAEHIVTIPSIPPDAARRSLQQRPDHTACTFAFIGELHREIKGEDVLLRAFRDALTRLPDARLLMYGDGPDRASDEQLVRELDLLPHVDFRGVLEPRRLLEAIDDVDVVLLASHTEGMPRVILEAFARGKPVIATRVGGIPEVVHHEQNGLLVPPNDVTALSAAMITLGSDLRHGQRLGQAGRAWIDTLPTWDTLASRIETAYPN